MTISLRPYQQEALDAINTFYDKGIKKQLIVLPTGAGKTIIFSHIPLIKKDSLPMLVLAHREELLEQAKTKIEWSNPDLSIDIEQGDRHAGHTDIVIASVPTLGRSESKRIEKYSPDYFKSIVIDEAHHAAAPTYRRILDYFNSDFTLGVTATPQRSDNTRLTDVFDDVVYYKTIQDLIEDGFLCSLVGYRVKTTTDISSVATHDGDYVASQLEDAINNPTRNAAIVSAYNNLVPDSKAVVFCAGVKHANDLAASFTASNIATEVILGTTDSDLRSDILQRFKEGSVKVIVNVGVLTEGFDEPTIQAIILARPTRSNLLYTQIVGRGTRLSDGKPHCTIIDIADTTRGKKPIGLPSLLGLPPDFDLEGKDLVKIAKQYKDLESYCPGEAVRVLSPEDIELAYKRIDLFMPPPPNEFIQQYSRFVWAEISDNVYHLGIDSLNSLRIYLDPIGRWTVDYFHRKDGQLQNVILAHFDNMQEAFSRSDKWIINNFNTTLIDSSASWRADAPTDAQKKLLKRIGVPLTADMTKGIASQIISKYYENNPRPQWLDNKIKYNRSKW